MNWKKRSIKYLKITLKTFTIIWNIIKGIFITYAVVFSVAGTIALITAVLYISKPILKVKRLRTENPAETRYMTSYRESMKDSAEVDTLMHTFVPLDSISDVLVKAPSGERRGDEISLRNPVPLRRNAEVVLRVEGQSLAPGDHEVVLNVSILEAGALTFRINDTV